MVLNIFSFAPLAVWKMCFFFFLQTMCYGLMQWTEGIKVCCRASSPLSRRRSMADNTGMSWEDVWTGWDRQKQSCKVPPPPPAAVRWRCVTLSLWLWKSTLVIFEQKRGAQPENYECNCLLFVVCLIVKHNHTEFRHIDNIKDKLYRCFINSLGQWKCYCYCWET